PGDCVALARACGMLDEIPVAGTMLTSVRDELARCVQLVVAREDQVLPLDPLAVDLLLSRLDVDEALEDVQPTVTLEHLLQPAGRSPRTRDRPSPQTSDRSGPAE